MTENQSPIERELKLEYLATNSLVPYDKNARTHSAEQVEILKMSIERFGFINPIIVDADNRIIAGHGRLMAAKELLLKRVPVLRAEGLTDDEIRAYTIADNQIALRADWDENLLRAEINDLKDDFDFVDTIGFEHEFLESLFDDDGAEEESGDRDEDDIDVPIAKPVTRNGDVWIIGDHRLMCGSCTIEEDVKKLLDSTTPDLVFADPPYGIDAVQGDTVGGTKGFGSVGGKGKIKANKYVPIAGDNDISTARNFFSLSAALKMKNFLIWGGNYFTGFLPPSKGWAVWDKKGRAWDDNFSDFEMAWTSFDVPAKIFTHVWMGMVQSGEREKRVHPTQKPIALCSKMIEFYSPKGKSVYDGFGGSGSTMAASQRIGRASFLMELEPLYCDIIIRRMRELFGLEATLVETGSTFEEMREERYKGE